MGQLSWFACRESAGNMQYSLQPLNSGDVVAGYKCRSRSHCSLSGERAKASPQLP